MHKALGRGLESLISVQSMPAGAPGESVILIALDKIKPNRYQPRKHFNETKLKELAESIRQHGLAQPLLVTPSMVPGEYELIAGERRLKACKLAGLKEASCVVRQANDHQRFQLSLIENIQRENLNVIEEAKAYQRLGAEFSMTQEVLAAAMGKDRSVVANALRLLSLPLDIQESIEAGHITSGHGRMLAGIDDGAKQKALAYRIINERLTVREIEKIVADWKSVAVPDKKKAKKQDADLFRLSEELQRRFGTKVKIVGKPKKGKIEIHYFSLKELERVTALMKGKK